MPLEDAVKSLYSVLRMVILLTLKLAKMGAETPSLDVSISCYTCSVCLQKCADIRQIIQQAVKSLADAKTRGNLEEDSIAAASTLAAKQVCKAS